MLASQKQANLPNTTRLTSNAIFPLLLLQNFFAFGVWSWEVYGDWTPDEAKLETEVVYLLS